MAEEHNHLDAIAFLAADHARVQGFFRGFAANVENAARGALLADACAALKIHAALEAEIFYPAARAALGPGPGSIIDLAEADHVEVARLIGELARVTLDDPAYAGLGARLAERVARHVEREEREIFPAVRSSRLDLDALGTRLRRRKDALEQAAELPGQVEPSADAEGAYEPELDQGETRRLAD